MLSAAPDKKKYVKNIFKKLIKLPFSILEVKNINDSKFCFCSLLINHKMNSVDTKSNFLTCERREEEGMAGRVATPPVVSAEVTRLCRLETETSWTNNYLRRREKVTCCQ